MSRGSRPCEKRKQGREGTGEPLPLGHAAPAKGQDGGSGAAHLGGDAAGGASSPLCFQQFDPSWSHHVAKASGFLSLPSKASATQAASPGTADTSGCLAKKHFFPLLPLPEMTRNRFPPLTALRRIPRPSASGLVSSHLAKEALAAVVCWTCLGTHTHTHTHTASLFVRPWQAMCFPNTKELCVPLLKRSVLSPCFA